MPSDDNPRLCGGVFLTYLLDARKQRINARKHYAGESDGLSDTEVFAGLIRVINPGYLVPSGATFKQNTSAYKNCQKSTGTYLPFTGTADARSFCDVVRTNYQVALLRMRAFTDKFIDVGTESRKDEQLVMALIEVIENDDTIGADAEFFAQEDGTPVTKALLIMSTDYCLQAFLVGVWDYILQHCSDNSAGRDTVKLWQPTAGYLDRLSVHNCTAQAENTNDTGTVATEDEQTVIEDATEGCSTDREQKQTQTVNNPVVFNQYGKNGIQIGSVETLVIRHGD